MRRPESTWIAIGVLTLTACGVPPGSGGAEVATSTTMSSTTTTEAVTTTRATPDFDCPVTIPPEPGLAAPSLKSAVYSGDFPEPDPFPQRHPHEGMVWYGTEDLWTALDVDGDHGGRKSVWWSVNFQGGIVEGTPEITVTWTRLDGDERVIIDNGGEATNAYTPEEGWFMIAGGDPVDPGCWEVQAEYEGASLSYVYHQE